MKDNISDMLTRIRNGQKARLFEIQLFYPVSKVCLEILNILYKEGYIRGFKKSYVNKKLFVKVLLKYDLEGNPIIKKYLEFQNQVVVYILLLNLFERLNLD